MIKAIDPTLDDKDGTFWMCFADFLDNFRALNVCRVSIIEALIYFYYR